jgi:hypothetical protein
MSLRIALMGTVSVLATIGALHQEDAEAVGAYIREDNLAAARGMVETAIDNADNCLVISEEDANSYRRAIA